MHEAQYTILEHHEAIEVNRIAETRLIMAYKYDSVVTVGRYLNSSSLARRARGGNAD